MFSIDSCHFQMLIFLYKAYELVCWYCEIETYFLQCITLRNRCLCIPVAKRKSKYCLFLSSLRIIIFSLASLSSPNIFRLLPRNWEISLGIYLALIILKFLFIQQRSAQCLVINLKHTCSLLTRRFLLGQISYLTYMHPIHLSI